MGPRPPRPPAAPAKRPARPVVVEHRSLGGSDSPRLQPKPDAAQQLREVAETMQDLPRACIHDAAELVTLMRRLAGRLRRIADCGLEVIPTHGARAPRQPFLPRPQVGAQAIAEAVFGPGQRGRRTEATTVIGRKGQRVRVEVRRARLSGQMELKL